MPPRREAMSEAVARAYEPVAGLTHRHSEGIGWREHNHLAGGVPHQHDPDTGFQIPVATVGESVSGDLVAFLAARLDEDEAAAKAWLPRVRLKGSSSWYDELNECDLGPYSIEHAERHDPARVLREVAAKRVILELHVRAPRPSPRSPDCRECQRPPWPCLTLRHLAAVYSDHPDYRQEWAPR